MNLKTNKSNSSGAPGVLVTARNSARGLLRRCAGFSLEEVVMSVAITAITIGSIATGYINTAQRAEWSAMSAAAQNSAAQRTEQVRAAKWDTQASPGVDEVVSANFPVQITTLDLPVAGNNTPYATNTTTITTVSVSPPVKMIRTDCTWSFMNRGVFTNTSIVYRSPDQ